MAEEKIWQKKALWDEEKEMILRDLQNRVDKVVWLEISLDEAREAYWWLESSFGKGDKELKWKIDQLERNVQQLTLMYHQVVSEKSVLKVDNNVFQHKIEWKEEKINQLEIAMDKLWSQNIQLKDILNQIKQRFGSDTKKALVDQHSLTGMTSNSRIKKKIKGGAQ